MNLPSKCFLLAATVLAVVACAGDRKPRRTLRSGMLELDGDYRELRTILGVPAKHDRALKLVTRMRAWADDPVFANRTKSAAFQGSAENFEQHRAYYVQTMDALKTAVETKDPGAMMAYARVNMSCELCHKEFRPGL